MKRWTMLFAGLCACGGAATTRPASLAVFEVTSPAELVTAASSEYSEVRLAVSPDGATMLWGSTNRPGGAGGWDIWVTRRSGATWSAPVTAGFNSAANDFDPAFSPDGRFVYFFSNRDGGLGGDDLYRVPVADDHFGAVEHLDGAVNSAGNEWAPTPLADGSLLFATDGRGGAGRHDLFLAAAAGTRFAAATPLPGAINTPADEFDAAMIPGGGLVFSRSSDVDADPILLLFAARRAGGYDAGTPLPLTVNVEGGYTLGPAVDLADPSLLYFSGMRPESAAGKLDVYRVHYRVR